MAGIEHESCVNIYNPEQKAWKCPLTRSAADVIADYYSEIGKQLPECVADVLNA